MPKKKIITIQLPPMLVARIWQFGKDQGLPKQVAIEKLIKYGFAWLEERGGKRRGKSWQ